MADYTLPDLPYDYAALEPHISARIMELHHTKHHAAYVAGANTALEKLAEARESGDFSKVNQFSKDLAFHLGGHVNHSIFWKNLSPDGGDKPEGDLLDAIANDFGSFDRRARRRRPSVKRLAATLARASHPILGQGVSPLSPGFLGAAACRQRVGA